MSEVPRLCLVAALTASSPLSPPLSPLTPVSCAFKKTSSFFSSATETMQGSQTIADPQNHTAFSVNLSFPSFLPCRHTSQLCLYPATIALSHPVCCIVKCHFCASFSHNGSLQHSAWPTRMMPDVNNRLWELGCMCIIQLWPYYALFHSTSVTLYQHTLAKHFNNQKKRIKCNN